MFCWAGEIWRFGVVHLVVFAWDLRLKKVVNFFRKKCTPPEKILATPVNLHTPGKVLRAPMMDSI